MRFYVLKTSKTMMIVLILLFSSIWNVPSKVDSVWTDQTETLIVETIPNELNYDEKIISSDTYEEWLKLVNSANKSIEIASMYWTMLGHDVMPNPVPESETGEKILEALIEANKERSVKLRIAVSADRSFSSNKDFRMLANYSQIRQVNFTRLIGAGVLHTKFIIIDEMHFYLGSANMDWRSLTRVKEMGIIMLNNRKMAQDLLNIFEIYWYLGQDNSTIPNTWPENYAAAFNLTNPCREKINAYDQYDMCLSSSPRQLCSKGRTNDLDAILSIINQAQEFLYIAVMDYFPMFLYRGKQQTYWSVIDDALRKAVVERNVQIRLLASHWNHTRPIMPIFLKSLAAFDKQRILGGGSIETRLFTFPECPFLPEEIPFSSVNHNKYMITEKTLYIGTSNWSADYFVDTGGVAIIMNVTDLNKSFIHKEMKKIFLRDWNSFYAKSV